MHRSLIHAENALQYQSEMHPDGWGVAYYLEDCPHLVKSIETAVDDTLFQKVSGVVSSKTVLAHLRKTTIGENSILNTHPFQHGKWVFGHNGNIKNFGKLRRDLENLISEELKSYLLGSTDSEVIFYIVLTELNKHLPSSSSSISSKILIRAVEDSIKNITKIIGAHSTEDSDPPSETFLSFILTNGSSMVAYNGGKTIHYSTHKDTCPDKSECAFYNSTCENRPSNFEGSQKINHLILSSEPIKGANLWNTMPPGEIIGVDDEMRLFRAKI
jgi:glutamine amidotransferase